MAKWYLRNTTASNAPNATGAPITADITATNATTAKDLSTTKGTTETSQAHTASTVSGNAFMGIWVTPALQAYTIPIGTTFQFGIEASQSSTAYNGYIFGYVYLYRPGVGKVCEVGEFWQHATELSGTGRVVTSEGTNDDIAINEGDKLVFEVWIAKNSTGSYLATVFYDGTNDVTEGSGTSAASWVDLPAGVVAQDTTRTFIEEFSDTKYKDTTNTTGEWNEHGESAQTTRGTPATDYNVTSAPFAIEITTPNWQAQSFTASTSGLLTSVDIFFTKDTGNYAQQHHAVIEIQSDNAGVPSGTVLARKKIYFQDIVTSALATINFPQAPTLVSGTKYHVVIYKRSAISSVDLNIQRNNNNPYANGSKISSTNSGSTWTADTTNDYRMTVYITPTTTGNKTIQSLGYDTGYTNVTYGTPTITKDEPTNTSVGTIEWSDSADNTTFGAWTSSLTTLTRRYVRWRTTTLNTTVTSTTPRLKKISFTYSESTGSPVTVNPSVQSITSSQQAATVTATRNVTISPSVQSITASQPSLIVTAQRIVSVSPAVQALTVAQQAPTVSITRSATINAAVQNLTSSQQAPTITANRSVTISAGVQSIIVSQQTPTITAVRNVAVSTGVQSITSSQQAPVITPIRAIAVSPAVQAITANQITPTITVGDGAKPAPQTGTFTVVNPIVTAVRNVTVSPVALSVTSSQIGPVVRISETLLQEAQPASFSQQAPSVTTVRNVVATPLAQTLLVSQQSPVITPVRNITVNPTVQVVTSNQNIPTVTTQGSRTVFVGVQTLTANQINPTVTVGDGVLLPSQNVTATQNNPIVTARRNVIISPVAQVITGNKNSPTVATTQSITVLPNTQGITASVISPVIIAGRSIVISPSVQELYASWQNPTVAILVPGLYKRGDNNLYERAGNMYNSRGGDLYNNSGNLQTQKGDLYDSK